MTSVLSQQCSSMANDCHLRTAGYFTPADNKTSSLMMCVVDRGVIISTPTPPPATPFPLKEGFLEHVNFPCNVSVLSGTRQLSLQRISCCFKCRHQGGLLQYNSDCVETRNECWMRMIRSGRLSLRPELSPVSHNSRKNLQKRKSFPVVCVQRFPLCASLVPAISHQSRHLPTIPAPPLWRRYQMG